MAFYCKTIIEYDHEMLVYKLSDGINHIAMFWEFAEIYSQDMDAVKHVSKF